MPNYSLSSKRAARHFARSAPSAFLPHLIASYRAIKMIEQAPCQRLRPHFQCQNADFLLRHGEHAVKAKCHIVS
jgi:hypothetical protein